MKSNILLLAVIISLNSEAINPHKEMTRSSRRSVIRRYTKPDGSEVYEEFDDNMFTTCRTSKDTNIPVRCKTMYFDSPVWRGRWKNEETIFDPINSIKILNRLKKAFADAN